MISYVIFGYYFQATSKPQVDCIAAVFVRGPTQLVDLIIYYLLISYKLSQKWHLLGRTEVHINDRHPTFGRAVGHAKQA
jgi:hypothetical protein